MKKILLLATLSINFLTFNAKTTLHKNDSIASEHLIEVLALTPILEDTFVNNVSIDVVDNKGRLTPKQDSMIVQQVDVIVRAVASVIPGAAPYTSIIGGLTTIIGYFIVRLKWKRKHRKEIDALKPKE